MTKFNCGEITYIGNMEYLITAVDRDGICIQNWINDKQYTQWLRPEEAQTYLRHFVYDIPDNNSPVLTLNDTEIKDYLRPRILGGVK